jgi:hypothetical protein
MIDWIRIVKYINERYETSFKTHEELLIELYKRTKSTTQMCSILGVSHNSLRIKMKKAGIIIASKGGANYRGKYKPAIMEMSKKEIAKMNLTELTEKIGCSRKYIRELLRREKIKYTREDKCQQI